MSARNCPDVLVENYGTTSSGLLWSASNSVVAPWGTDWGLPSLRATAVVDMNVAFVSAPPKFSQPLETQQS
jgi:hypothetical protein